MTSGTTIIPVELRKMSSKTSSVSGIMPAAPSSSKPAAPAKVAKKEKSAAAVAAPVAAPAPAAAEPKAKKSAKAAAPAAAPVVVSATPVEQVAAAAPVAPATTLEADLKSLATRLNSARELLASLVSEVKKLDKRVHKEIKEARKRRRRSKPEEGAEGAEAKPRVPSIFERPLQVTEALCSFLGKPKGTLMSRSEVTKGVNSYVKEKNLKNKHDITPDAALKGLLAIPEGETLTYFNLQRYLNPHYLKTPVATA